jgi:hypothetical protein
MSTEVLVCLSYKHFFNVEGGIIKTTGKQYCWIEKLDYIQLKDATLCISLGAGYKTKLQIEEIKDEVLILAMLSMGNTLPFSSFSVYIGNTMLDMNADQFFVYFEKEIKRRCFSINHLHQSLK